MAYCPAVLVKLFLLLNVPEKVTCPEPDCKIMQLNPSGIPVDGKLNVMAEVHLKIIPLSLIAIALLEASALTLETKPLNLEVAELPPVKFPAIDTFPAV